MTHGGKREGCGRKSKADELVLIETLKPLDAIAFEALKKGVTSGDFQFVKLFFEYRYGRPKMAIDIDAKIESKSFNIGYKIIEELDTE